MAVFAKALMVIILSYMCARSALLYTLNLNNVAVYQLQLKAEHKKVTLQRISVTRELDTEVGIQIIFVGISTLYGLVGL